MFLTTVILTKDEELHIARALDSISSISDCVMVVDSGSVDSTTAIAAEKGATVYHRAWTNHAEQFNWALEKVPRETEWVLRLDADEIASDMLCNEISELLASLDQEVSGVLIPRTIYFQSRRVKYGGVGRLPSLRLFRKNRGSVEQRLMDEHIVVQGKIHKFKGEILDINLKPLDWWISKHNQYASLEAIHVLDKDLAFLPDSYRRQSLPNGGLKFKRLIKDKIYHRIPLGLRALLYFLYRSVVRLGLLDCKEGRMYHVLQGFWYRYLVDAKVMEVRSFMLGSNVSVELAIKEVLGINLSSKLSE